MSKAEAFAKRTGKDQWLFYKTKSAKEYIDSYAAFVKKYQSAIDYYSNVDVIGNAELTWRNQRYLENVHQLDPVPVVHYRTDLKWLHHYIEKGYDYIALGGMVRYIRTAGCKEWLQRAWGIVCNQPTRLPQVKIHGFGITNWKVMCRYPWYSLDSAAWDKRAGFGIVLIPHKRNGKFDFNHEPYQLFFSDKAPAHNQGEQHYNSLSKGEKRIVHEWLEKVDVEFGDSETMGVSTHHSPRKCANLRFFEYFRKAQPEYPFALKVQQNSNGGVKGYGLLTKCIACGGTGKNSKGGPCVPCVNLGRVK